MANEILFRSDEVVVHFERRDSDTLLVAFGHMGMVGASTIWGADLARALGWSIMGINPTRLSWYPIGGFAGLPEEVGAICRSYRRRISYGGSMGGHGAVKCARVFGATLVIAGAPQISIDPADVASFDKRFQGLFDPAVQGRGAIVATDITAETYLLVDPHNEADWCHAHALAALSKRVHILKAINTHHAPLSALAGTRVFAGFADALAAGDVAGAYRVMTAQRRRSDIRKGTLAVDSWISHPDVARSILRSLEETASPHLIGEIYWRIGLVEEYRDRFDSALEMYRRAMNVQPDDVTYKTAENRIVSRISVLY